MTTHHRLGAVVEEACRTTEVLEGSPMTLSKGDDVLAVGEVGEGVAVVEERHVNDVDLPCSLLNSPRPSPPQPTWVWCPNTSARRCSSDATGQIRGRATAKYIVTR